MTGIERGSVCSEFTEWFSDLVVVCGVFVLVLYLVFVEGLVWKSGYYVGLLRWFLVRFGAFSWDVGLSRRYVF